METGKMKNMVVIKDLPSNIIEEAIVIFKSTSKIKEKELIDKTIKKDREEGLIANKDYIVKDAEIVIENYISNLENKKNKSENLKNKYEKLRLYSVVLSVLFVISFIINFI